MSNEPVKTMMINTMDPSGDAEKDTEPNAAGTGGGLAGIAAGMTGLMNI